MVVVSLTPRPLYSGGRASGTHWTGTWVSSTAGLDELEKGEPLAPARWTPDSRGRNLGINVNSLVLKRTDQDPRKIFPEDKCLLFNSFFTVRSDNWFKQATHLQFRRTSVQTYQNNSVFALSVSPDYLFCVMFAQIVFKDCYEEGNDTVSVFFYTRPWTSPRQIRNDRP